MRLSGWQRLGIIASFAWMIYGAVHGAILASFIEAGSFGTAYLIAFYAFVPVIFGWIGIWFVLCLARWVLRGFSLDPLDVE